MNTAQLHEAEIEYISFHTRENSTILLSYSMDCPLLSDA